ncbi:hypothetical protein FRC16_010367 [Serendipita sp. 398]|nr:hypothetical protein FRC16_010367 [Serendipita sp. 398]
MEGGQMWTGPREKLPDDIEIASPGHTLDPWRPDIQDNQYGERFKVSPAVKGINKAEAAEAHREHIARIANNPNAIAVYTDGSLIHDGGHTRAGAGWVLYSKGEERATGSVGLGTTAEVYDAEMTALSKGLHCAIDHLTNTPSYHVDTHASIFLFSDNTSAVRSIPSAALGSSQSESQDFLEAAKGFLDGHPQTSIHISWVPGHRNILGNDRADGIAKAACHLEPQTTKTTLAHYYRTVKKSLIDAWRNAWTETPRRGNYAIADRLPPSILGSYPFRQYDRATFGLITQVRTGHGHFGEYYRRFNIPEPYECPCGIAVQTRAHIIFECPQYDEARHIIYTAAPDGHIGTLLGTKKGIDGLATFIRQTNAFRKPPLPAPATPPPPPPLA